LFHLPRSTPRKLANASWAPRPLKPIASRKRRARFESSPRNLPTTTSPRTIKSGRPLRLGGMPPAATAESAPGFLSPVNRRRKACHDDEPPGA
jgi:hypothetical protein